MASANVSRHFTACGPSSTIVTACAASTQSIGDAAEVIRRGAADVMITGGTEAGISQLGLAGFCVMRALSTTHNDVPSLASRPFDADRDGFVPAEGAGILIVESLEHALRRGASILAEVIGYGASSDANHQVQPDDDGAGAARAIRWALDDAGIGPHEVDYINAHGTSTPLNDASETLAIKRTFGDLAYNVPISSTKSMIGHALGGAGGMEAVACVKTIVKRCHSPHHQLHDARPWLRPRLRPERGAQGGCPHGALQQLRLRRAERLPRLPPLRGVTPVIPAQALRSLLPLGEG